MGQGMGMTNSNIWMNAAAGAASGVFDRLAQRIGVNYDQRKQLEQQKKLNALQIQSESQLMDIQAQKQMEMWKATSYPAQVEMLQKAGLNPGLLYGQSGGGGTTTGAGMPGASGGQSQSPNTHNAGMGIMNSAMIAGQMSLLDAQRKNIEADTANKEADTQGKLGKTPGAIAQIDNLQANTGNTKADTALKEIQAERDRIQLSIEGATKEQVIANLNTYSGMLDDQARQMNDLADITGATKEDVIDRIHAEKINAELQKALIESQTAENISKINLNNQTIKTQIQQVLQGWKSLDQTDTKQAIEQFKAIFNTDQTQKIYMATMGEKMGEKIGRIFQQIKEQQNKK